MAQECRLSVRPVVIEFGAIPTSACLSQIDSTVAISEILVELRRRGQHDDHYCYVDVGTLASCLDLSEQHAKVLIDIIDAITDAHHLFVVRQHGQSEAVAVDAHAVAMFLFAQLYIRQAVRPEAMDVWPAASSGMVAESLSPFGATSPLHATSSGGPVSPGGANHLPSAGSSGSGSPGVTLGSQGSGQASPSGQHHYTVTNHLHSPSSGGLHGSPFGTPNHHPHSPAPLSHLSLSQLNCLPSASSSGSQHSEPHMPQSPARSNSSTSSQGTAPIQFQQQKSNQLVRRDLQAHLAQHSALLHGYTDYIQRHAHKLLSLVLDSAPVRTPDGNLQEQYEEITAGEFDRLAFLLRASTGRWSLEQPGSPMDTSPKSPFSGEGWRLSLGVPWFKEQSESCKASFTDVAEWLVHSITQEQLQIDTLLSSPGSTDRALPPAGIVQGSEVDIQGVCKSTVVRGEEDFPSGNLKITDCHDSVIYALAPLQYAWVFCCSDCTVVIGAVARMLRVERCERLTLIAGAVRLCISSCHDSTFYLGVNRPSLLIGDNRTLQLGPYNTQYERLPVHLAAAGIAPEVNLWDQYVSFTRSQKQGSLDSHGADSPGTSVQSRPACQLLPPDKLLPFMIPFQGGRGAMCGGAASGVTRLAADLGTFVGLGESLPESKGTNHRMSLPSSPFQLPQAYQEAKEQKVQAVTDLRHHIKSAVLDESKKRDLQSTIQAYFKDWLTSTGKMREIYDLARMERDEGSSPRSPHGTNHPF